MEETVRRESINLVPIGRVINGIEYPSDVKGDLIEEATMPDWLLRFWELQDSGG
jgi:hypothetical protein